MNIAASSAFELAALANAAMPDLQVMGVHPPQLDDEIAQMTGLTDVRGNRWIVFAPRETKTHEELEAYGRLLTWLHRSSKDGTLNFSTPLPEVFISRSENRYAMVYPELGGEPLDENDLQSDLLLASSMGRSLARLHNLVGVPGVMTVVSLTSPEDTRKSVVSLIENTKGVPPRLVKRWQDAVEEDALWLFSPGFLHGDLTASTIQVTRSIVTAMTGFSAAQIDDPAMDLAWILPTASDEFVDQLMEQYSRQRTGVDLHLLTRAQLYSELAVLKWLLSGRLAHNQEIEAEAIAILEDFDEKLDGAGLVRQRRQVREISFTPEEEPLFQLHRPQAGDQPTQDSGAAGAELAKEPTGESTAFTGLEATAKPSTSGSRSKSRQASGSSARRFDSARSLLASRHRFTEVDTSALTLALSADDISDLSDTPVVGTSATIAASASASTQPAPPTAPTMPVGSAEASSAAQRAAQLDAQLLAQVNQALQAEQANQATQAVQNTQAAQSDQAAQATQATQATQAIQAIQAIQEPQTNKVRQENQESQLQQLDLSQYLTDSVFTGFADFQRDSGSALAGSEAYTVALDDLAADVWEIDEDARSTDNSA